MLRAELSVLADDILRFEPRGHQRGRPLRLRVRNAPLPCVAQAAFDEAPDEVDLVRAQRAVDEATWSMAWARAIVDGRRPPDPPATLQRAGHHGEPAIGLDDDDLPTYVGSNAPYRSGWFAAGGGLFGGLLVGTMLGGFGGWVADERTADADRTDGFDGGPMEW